MTPTAQTDWYALKVFDNRVNEMEQQLTDSGLEVYLPRVDVMVERNGRRKTVSRPLLGQVLFVRLSPERAVAMHRQLNGKAAFYLTASVPKVPAAIPDDQMQVFRILAGAARGDDGGLEFLGEDTARYSVGQRVRVTGGPFEGAEGHICRIKGNRRLVVTIRGICAVATSYIPSCFLQPVT